MKRDRIQWNASEDVVESARTVLPLMARDLFRAGREVTAGKAKVKDLHAFRLHVKRFRYTLELFQPLYGSALEKRLASLRQLQGHLGKMQDCSAARDLVLAIRRRNKKTPKVKRVLKLLDSLERDRVGKSLEYWRETFDSPDEEDRWVRYLHHYAGRCGTAGTGDAAKEAPDA